MTSELEVFELAKKAKFIAVDCEGDGRDVRDPTSGAVTMGVSIAFRTPNGGIFSEYYAFHHKIGENQPEFFEPLKDLLESTRDLYSDEGPIIVMHNGSKHDIAALKILGIDISKKFYYDTLSMIHFLKEELLSYKLDYLSRLYGGSPKAMSTRMKQIIELFGWENVPVKEMRPYSANDTVITLELFEKVIDEFQTQFPPELWITELEWFLYSLNPMEATGVLIDQDFCKRKIAQGEKAMAESIAGLGGLNPGSSNDLKTLLLDTLKLPVAKWTDHKENPKPSFDKDAMKIYASMLERSGNKTAQYITRYRGWRKVVSTNYKPYLTTIGNDGRLRPNYKVHGTSTSRLSCGSDSDGKTEVKSPNLQNIPKIGEKEWDGDLKQAFIPDPGYRLFEIDFSNLELRLTAAYSKDAKLVETFQAGRNVFDDMAKEMGWRREDCKTFVYATGYNAGDEKIARTFGLSSAAAGKRMRLDFFSKYRGMDAYKKKVQQFAYQKLVIKYWTGRKRHFKTKGLAKHLSFNSLIQGGAAELVKNRMIAVGKIIDWNDCKMVLQIHDSLTFLIREGTEDYWIPLLEKTMEDVPPILCKHVPFTVETKIWGSKEKYVAAN